MPKNTKNKAEEAKINRLGDPVRLSAMRGGAEGVISRINADGTVSVKIDGSPARFEHRVVLGLDAAFFDQADITAAELEKLTAPLAHSKSEVRRLAAMKAGGKKR